MSAILKGCGVEAAVARWCGERVQERLPVGQRRRGGGV